MSVYYLGVIVFLAYYQPYTMMMYHTLVSRWELAYDDSSDSVSNRFCIEYEVPLDMKQLM